MQDIIKEIVYRYGFEVKNITPYRDYYILYNAKEKKILKKCTLSEKRINFIHGAKEHLFNNGFINIDKYFCTLSGEPYLNIKDSNYLITSTLNGRECDFENNNDIINATKSLALLHKASIGYNNTANNTLSKSDLGLLPFIFQKRLGEIKKLKKIAAKRKTMFDYHVLSFIDYFYSLGDNAINIINSNSTYIDLVEKTKNEKSFCHHDFTFNNIILNDSTTSIRNFECCRYELKIYDIVNLIRRKMRKCYWDFNEAEIIFNEYQKIAKISKNEFFIMKTMLIFPQKFWRIINKYYNSKHFCSEKIYISKLEEVITEINPIKIFIKQFNSLL